MTTAETTVSEFGSLQNLASSNREIRLIRNWHEWLHLWSIARTVEEMLGLLHVGFMVTLGKWRDEEPAYDWKHRLIFYLNIADGWTDTGSLVRTDDGKREGSAARYNENGGIEKKVPSQLRQEVARKAFDVLCANCFRVDRNPYGFGVQDIATSDHNTFGTLQVFFGIETRFGFRTIRNLSARKGDRFHSEEFAFGFLIRLAKFIWSWEESEIPSRTESSEGVAVRARNARIRELIDTAKPWMVEVLSILGEIELLRTWILDLDEITLTKLREIAMLSELVNYHHRVVVIENRLVENLEEACLAGSPEARLIAEHELMRKQYDRLAAIRTAKIAQTEATETIARLSAKPGEPPAA